MYNIHQQDVISQNKRVADEAAIHDQVDIEFKINERMIKHPE